MTNAATQGARRSAVPLAATTPDDARPTWLRPALLGLVLTALGVLALVWDDGDRVLLGGLGALAAGHGSTLLRGARSGRQPRAAAASGALAVWFGAAAVLVALASGTATGWVLVAGLVLALPVLALSAADSSGPGRRVLLAGAGAVVVVAVLLGVLGGADTLRDVGTAAVAVLVAALGVTALVGAVRAWRLARQPVPAPAAGCGGCACGAGGCGSLR